MTSGLVLTTTHLPFNSNADKFPQFYATCSSPRFRILCSSSGPELTLPTGTIGNDGLVTGGAYDFSKATTSVTHKLLSAPKQVTLVRHGLSTWNDESRVQGSSNSSILTETGIMQAERCKKALVDIHFDQCFSSPISRAKSTAEIMWAGREESLIFLDTLKEAHLFYLEGMKNNQSLGKLADADRVSTPLSVDRIQIRLTHYMSSLGENFLVVTHKSMLRALICAALGLSPERFRAFDVNNGGISVFKFNKQGEAMLQSLNMTAHMYTDHTYLY
ncbi:Histidine phosphatase superfamily, clade-1 [Cynara cardunculus var. scolymus]|uniref:Histidine phosphatase superfamily, clade-1 n=1 Tax=Cynara cardunculus var. scolymus TaxID=59895 RepID=A0A118JXD9_CYNCS|nr:Histidine phosphatase superfamily, clade-1 [Cynara cardunculus var. scolymus]